MKKIKNLCLMLCLILLLQITGIPAFAAEETDPSETIMETTSEPEETVDPADIPEVEFGSASVSNGCRTINGMNPMAGAERILDTAQAAFVYEVNTQTVIYGYNPDAKLYPGSLAKILTALVALENGSMEDPVTFSTQWNSSLPLRAQVANLKEGEEVTLGDLLYWMMLESANDAALNIAGHIGGSQDKFVEMMNQKAAQLGCTGSHFVNAHGLDNDEQYTTARDVAKIVQAAIQNEHFKTIFGSLTYQMPATNKVEETRKVETDNHMMYQMILSKFFDDRVTGGKTSSTAESGSSLVCTAESKGMNLILVVMGAERRYYDNGNVDYYGNFDEMVGLLEFTFPNYKIARVLYPDMALTQFPVLGGECKVVGQPDLAVNSVVPANCSLDNLIFRYSVEGGGLKAPIEIGQKIGTVQVWYRTSCVTESEVYAMNSVRSEINSGVKISNAAARDDSNLTGILKFLLIAVLIIVVPLGSYLLINAARRAAAQRKRRRRRANRRRSR